MTTVNTNMHEERWNQWFAGLTDGDGCFYINKKENTISFEVTTHTTDVRVLYDIKNKLKTGSVKLRSNTQSVRFRVKNKEAILNIVNRLNGKLYNKARVAQFEQVCQMLNVKKLPTPALLEKDNGYISGLIDSDGSFAISVTKSSAEDSQLSGVGGRITRLTNAKGFSQISLKITSIDEDSLKRVQNSYGFGKIYKEKKSKSRINEIYHWTVKPQDEFQQLYECIKKNPLRSVKMHRMRLALLYFHYKELNYHLMPTGTIGSKIWAKFCKSWFKYSY